MEKYQIPIIILAIFSIVLLLGYDYQRVYANVSAIDFVYPVSGQESFYMESFQYFVTLDTGLSTSARLTFIHGATETPENDATNTGNFLTLTAQRGGCTNDDGTGFNPNPCSATSGSANCNPATFGINCSTQAGVTGTWGGLWCGLTDCFVLFRFSTGGWSSQLIRINMQTEEISGYMNITATHLIDPYLWGYDESTGGIGGITLFWTHSDTSSAIATLHFTGGTSLMGDSFSGTTSICAQSGCAGGGANNRITDIQGCRNCNGNLTQHITRIVVSSTQEAAQPTNRLVTVFSDSGAQVCGGTQTSLGVSQSVLNTGKIAYLGDVKDLFVMATINEVVTLNHTTCASSTQYTYASQSLSNYVKGIAVDPDDRFYYLHHGTESTKASITKMNITSFTTSVDFDSVVGDTITGWVDGGFSRHQIAIATDDAEGLNADVSTDDWNTILILDNTAKARIIYPDGFVGIEPEPTSEGRDCSLPENANILICRLGGDGTLGSAGSFIVGNVTEGTGILGIGCSMGLVDCVADDNPQTNGLGLLIFIASIFVIVGMFFRTIGADNTFHMPIFIWVVIIIALSAFFTITGLIDPVFLIISVIAIIALAAPKVINAVRGSTFGGGSTE